MRIPVTILLSALLFLSGPLWANAPAAGQPDAADLAELKEKINGDNRNNPVVSVQCAEEALRKLAVEPDPASEIWFLTSLVGDLNALCDFPKAAAYLERGRKLLAHSGGDQRAHCLLEIEGAAMFVHSEKPKEAKQILDSLIPSLESFRSRDLKDSEIGHALGRGYRFRGMVFQTIGQYSEAIGAYQKAQKLAKELGDRREQAVILDQMGTLYTLLGRYKEAVASHRQAIQMAEALEDLALQAAFHLGLANTYGSRDDVEAHLAELKQAIELARKTEDVSTQIVGMVNLADVYLRKKDYLAALQYADAAMKLPEIFKDPGNVAVCQINRGIALNRLGKGTEGLAAIQEGLRYVRSTQDKSQIAEITGNLAEEYAFAGDYRKAYETEREFKALSDELKQVEDQKRIAEASASFESDKKQIQIEGLQREHRHQVRLAMLWIALGVLGLSVAGVLVFSRKKLQRVNASLTDLNDQNLELIEKLQSALSEVRTLQGLIPICSYCKKIRDDEGYWGQMEAYIHSQTGARFSHGICPDCAKEVKADMQRMWDSGK